MACCRFLLYPFCGIGSSGLFHYFAFTMTDQLPENLVQSFNEGSNLAFATIYNNCFDSIFFFTRSLVGVRQDAEDIAVDTFVKLWDQRGNFNDMDRIRGFLYTVARNACLDCLKHQRIKNLRREDIANTLLENGEMVFDREMISAQFRVLLKNEIEKLPAKCRTIFKMSYVDGMSNDQVAEHLQITTKTVINQKKLALARLRLNFLK